MTKDIKGRIYLTGQINVRAHVLLMFPLSRAKKKKNSEKFLFLNVQNGHMCVSWSFVCCLSVKIYKHPLDQLAIVLIS